MEPKTIFVHRINLPGACLLVRLGQAGMHSVMVSMLLLSIIFSLILQILGEGKSEAAGLLTGATASSFTVPSGWQVYDVQGFESGAINLNTEFIRSGITTTRAHTGTRSLGGTYTRSGSDVSFGVFRAPSEVYVSFWDYLDSQGRNNDELWLWQGTVRSPVFQEVILDYLQANCTTTPCNNFNALTGARSIIPQGAYFGNLGAADDGGVVGFGAGWQQHEIHFKANSPGVANGIFQYYKNGVLITNYSNIMMNGNINMNGMQMQVGGIYTKLIWRKTSPCTSFGAFIGDGQTSGCPVGSSPIEICTDFQHCVDPNINQPYFQRFIDDVIILVPTGSVTLPPPQPAPPTGLNVNP